MRYNKQLSGNYIVAIRVGLGGEEITEAEYNKIMNIIQNRPQAEGKGYRLTTDLAWEEYDLPPEEIADPEATPEAQLAALDTAYTEGVNSL